MVVYQDKGVRLGYPSKIPAQEAITFYHQINGLYASYSPSGRIIPMNREQHLKEHLEICKRIFEDMQRDGSWPWTDSPNPENLLESENSPDDI
jgi:hypothetical protein